eukprot:5947737-Amphidinium_carterae.1
MAAGKKSVVSGFTVSVASISKPPLSVRLMAHKMPSKSLTLPNKTKTQNEQINSELDKEND